MFLIIKLYNYFKLIVAPCEKKPAPASVMNTAKLFEVLPTIVHSEEINLPFEVIHM